MKPLLTGLFLILSTLYVNGQAVYRPGMDTTYIVKYDTINVRGKVYSYDGQPVINIKIGYFPSGFHPPGFPVFTNTDHKGNFELKGAHIDDRLVIFDGRYIHVLFPVNGSRYMVIYLPPAKVLVLNNDTVKITAPRKKPKIVPSFRVHDKGIRIFDHQYNVIYPRPKIGQSRFFKLLNDSLFYPESAINNNIEGLVKIGFRVNKTGDLYDFRILKGIGYGCDEQVIQFLKKAGKWDAGICNGDFFSVQTTIAVQFSLSNK